MEQNAANQPGGKKERSNKEGRIPPGLRESGC
jgi:hypothetical protein